MNKILFLDFDGVLHPTLCPETEHFIRLPALLESIATSAANMEVVISSSWRFQYDFEELLNFFPDDLRKRVSATTGPPVVGKHSRYREILAYLGNRRNQYQWRALDDCAWEFPENCPELILCNGAKGVTSAELKCLQIWLHDNAAIG